MNKIDAYWLGFLFADGSIRNNTIMLNLSIKDREHIVKFAKYTGKDETCIKDFEASFRDKRYPATRFSFSNKEYAEFCRSYGIIENKTKNQKQCPLLLIPDKFKYHWLRGYFDGDGTIAFKDNKQPMIGFCAFNKEILEGVFDFLKNDLDLNIVNIRKDSGSYKLFWGGNHQVIKIREALYKNSGGLFLERKYLKLKDIKKIRLTQTSDYIGVHYRKVDKKWVAKIKINKKTKSLGYFINEIDAALAYDKVASTLNRKTNFNGEADVSISTLEMVTNRK